MTHEPRYLYNSTKCTFACSCNNAVKFKQPKLYELTSDPGERNPIDSSSLEYSDIMKVIAAETDSHKASLPPVESQFTFAKLRWRHSLQQCCNGTFPHCQCTDLKYANTI